MWVSPQLKSKKMNLWAIWRRFWLLFSILFVILLAEISPELGIRDGPLRPEITVKFGAVFVMFFLSGLSLTTEDIVCAVKQYDLHIFVQTFTLLIMPLLVTPLTSLLEMMGVNMWICKGLVLTSCMPPSFASSVIITRAVGGNEAAAIFNAILGSVLAIFATPFTLLFFLSSTTMVPPVATIIDLILTVATPVMLGHGLHYLMGIRTPHILMEFVSNIALLLIIYNTFCETFISHESTVLNPINILVATFLVVVLQLFFLILIFHLASSLRIFSPTDIVTIMFSSTHKSVSLGIPILRILYSGYDHLNTISLPLLIYYPTQIILGSLLVSELRDWARKRRSRPASVQTSQITGPRNL